MPSSSPRQPLSVRAALRGATKAIHQRMHRLEPFAAIANGTLGAERYPSLLQSLLLFHSTIGDAANRHGWSALSGAATRADLLRGDLRRLGGGPRPAPLAWQPASATAMLGALYAAEGSMMGGRVLARQLDYLLGDALDARRFFIGTPDDAARWNALIAALEEHCSTRAARGQAIDGARSAFRLFEQCIMRRSAGHESGCPAMLIARSFQGPRLAGV